MNLSIRQWLASKFIRKYYREALNSSNISGISLRIITELDNKSLTCFDICPLAEILELPVSLAWQEIPLIAQLTQSLLSNLSQKKPLKRNEGTWQGFQIAYLQALLQILEQEIYLKKPWLNRAMFWSDGEFSFPLQDVQLQDLLKTLQGVKLTDTQAEQAMSLVADSLLVQQMNSATVAWLRANGADETEAKLIVQRLSHSLPGHLLEVIAQNAAGLAQLQKFVRLQVYSIGTGSNTGANIVEKSLSVYASDKIDLHCEQYRASLIKFLAEPLFLESFSLKDIYVPPKGLLFDINSSVSTLEPKTVQLIDLTTWLLEELEVPGRITFIEAEAGYGKTSFCRMFAAKVAQELYPSWMPILIRLRNIKEGDNFIDTLCSSMSEDFSLHLAEWLNRQYPRCLLILDGLDELENTSKISKTKFIEQLVDFQSWSQHKVILTSRPSYLPSNINNAVPFKRIAIQPFEQEQLRIWFQNWTIVQSAPVAQNFFMFLKQAGLFSSKSKLPEFTRLVRQPLMLYLLAILYRDGLLDDEVIEIASQAKQRGSAFLVWEIYQCLNRWLLGYPSTGGVKSILIREGTAHIYRTQDAVANLLQNHHPKDIRAQMLSAALKILHSQQHTEWTEELEANTLTLPAFYFDNRFNELRVSSYGVDSQRILRFSHPKLGEILCADAIADQLRLLSQRQRNEYGELSFLIDSNSFAQHIYNLFGYGILSLEIGELVTEALHRQENQDFSLTLLCERLLMVWHGYCQGRWFDEGIVHNARNYFKTLRNPLNVEQINAAVGLNLFFLLCDCHRILKRAFTPCTTPEALTQLISRVSILAPQAFQGRISPKSFAAVNLSNVDLTQVSLVGVCLEGVNLAGAKLAGANLAHSNLSSADLTGADLTGANLERTNLTNAKLLGANLECANLTGTKLTSAIFTNACLYNAILSEIDKETVRLQGAMFIPEEYRALKQLLAQKSEVEKSHVPHSTTGTNIWLKSTPEIGLIESVEGEMLSEDYLYENEANVETFIGTY
ncbi:MAG: pentapeptide repeat-containing protein [Calothrix sp. C42_A2020_038]|nr:pentapeptide repeat-containing protein [Calothrix sp. C42_A2020_038]